MRLINAYSRSDHSEYHEKCLRPQNSTLNRRLLVFIFPLLCSFSFADCLLSLRWPGQKGNPPFLVQWGLIAIFLLICQWRVVGFPNKCSER